MNLFAGMRCAYQFANGFGHPWTCQASLVDAARRLGDIVFERRGRVVEYNISKPNTPRDLVEHGKAAGPVSADYSNDITDGWSHCEKIDCFQSETYVRHPGPT